MSVHRPEGQCAHREELQPRVFSFIRVFIDPSGIGSQDVAHGLPRLFESMPVLMEYFNTGDIP